MRRLAPAAAAAAITALLLSGCSMGASDSTAPMVEAPPGPVAPQPGEVQDQAGDQSAQSAASAADPDAADRSVITTGWASITVDDPIASAEDAATIAEEAGGRVDNRTESPGTDAQPPSASLTLRVPADRVDEVVDELRTLGTVNSVSMNASDVTQQRQDLDARIEALSVSVDRLTELLATATTVSDLIAIESELTTRQAELDSLTQQRDSLVDQVDFATIGLELVTASAAPDPQPDDFWSGIVVGWNALVGFAAWLGVAIGVMLPWLLAALVTAAVVILVVVLTTRRRRTPEA
ncbi:DUF4349 domain-containing protein [Agromyces humi]|uniref:DUF4349 domain-containing protein n=1 Tax=Agromyces humi TaxID=1766800 RepID=UPI00135B72E6|nr:DUF4349 domain-containing protein [Agromyces humi]